MAGILGSRSKAAYDVTGLEKLGLGKQILNQIGMNLLGVDFEGQRVSDALAQIQRQAAMQAAGLLTPQTIARQAKIGNADGEDISAGFAPEYDLSQRQRTPQEIAQGLARLAATVPGFNPTPYKDLATLAMPETAFESGVRYNRKDPSSAPAFVPQMDKNQEPLFDRAGNIVGVRNMDGSVQAAADMAGAVEGAKAKAQAPFQAVQTYGPGGAPKTITALELSQGGGGTGQSPAQNAADTARATAGAQADINLPQVLGSANQAIALIEQMKSHPGLDSGVGWRGALPPLPNTPGADFRAMQEQLKGKVFLEAFGQLKGAGQITEVEGQKATQAIARLSNTQTKEGYLAALDDLEKVIDASARRAASQASRLQPNAAGGAAPQGLRPNLSSVPVADRMAEARRRGLIP